MKILVTGAQGFIGRNLLVRLRRENMHEVLPFDVQNSDADLEAFLAKADCIVHLAGINRPLTPEEYMQGNFGLTSRIVEFFEEQGKQTPIIFSSSIQAERENEYGKSKRAAEDRLRLYAERTGASVSIFRFANVFGKWCRPNYNSAVATFCYNIAHELSIAINDPSARLRLIYIDDVVDAIVRQIAPLQKGFAFVDAGPVYETTVGKVAEYIRMLHDYRKKGYIPDFADEFLKKLNTTYLSYIDADKLALEPELKSDQRGWLFELMKSAHAGQIFVSTTRPGFTRGNHYHDTKVEKFCLVKGKACITLRRIDAEDKIIYEVDDAIIQVVDIPPGYTHSIENTGTGDCIVLFWANEVFDTSRPDTYFLEV